MIELFQNIPEDIKFQTKFWVDRALSTPNILEGAKMVLDYRNSCITEAQKAFVDFYFQLRLEELRK